MSKMFHITPPDVSHGVNVQDQPYIPPHLLLNFIAVCQHKSIRHAATVQCMPQTALARNMARLEGIIGQSLIHQQPGRFRLTPVGQRVFDALREDANALQSKVQVALAQGTLVQAPQAPVLAMDVNIWGVASVLRPYLKDLQSLGCGLNFLAPHWATGQKPDVRCYLAQNPLTDYENDVLFREEIIAVCATDYPLPDGGLTVAD
ncbi:MAG: LysR family transcriptional regulator, partial [Pseudomonadota bacterium]